MDFPMVVLMVFPAFLIGVAFGIGIVLGLDGDHRSNKARPVIYSVLGSMSGVVVFLLTANWWPPVVGPFILCPALAVISAFAGRKNA